MKTILLLISTTMCSNVFAGGIIHPYSQDSLQKLYAELHYLHQAGIDIHHQFDEKIATNSAQLLYCEGQYGFITARAKATIGIANRLHSANSEEYINASWKALECISCQGDVSSCEAIPPTLKTIQQEYKALKAN